jgi:antitoxin HigA-1
MAREIPMPRPGIVFREEFLGPMGLSVYATAKALHISRAHLNDICHGKRGISTSVALRLGKLFGVDPRWFLNMQVKYDLEIQREALAQELESIKPLPAVA